MTNPPYPQQPPLPPRPATPGYPPTSQSPAAPQAQPPGAAYPQPQRAGASEPRRGNPAGLVAVILVGVILVLEAIGATAGGFFLSSADGSYELYGVFTSVLAVLNALLAIAAIVLGAIGLAARSRPKGLAGIGLGGGAVVLFGLLSSQLTNLVLFSLNS